MALNMLRIIGIIAHYENRDKEIVRLYLRERNNDSCIRWIVRRGCATLAPKTPAPSQPEPVAEYGHEALRRCFLSVGVASLLPEQVTS